MQTYKLLAVLLDYPGGEIVGDLRAAVSGQDGALGLVRSVDTDEVFTGSEHASIAGFIDWMLAQDQTELEGRYVKTFDLTPEHSLHLTHHVFGDDKNRGPALIDLSEFYKSYGLQHDEHEIPDYLPMMLEFVSQLEETEARVFLTDAVKVFNVLATNLEKAESPYAVLVRVIENHSSLARQAA